MQDASPICSYARKGLVKILNRSNFRTLRKLEISNFRAEEANSRVAPIKFSQFPRSEDHHVVSRQEYFAVFLHTTLLYFHLQLRSFGSVTLLRSFTLAF